LKKIRRKCTHYINGQRTCSCAGVPVLPGNFPNMAGVSLPHLIQPPQPKKVRTRPLDVGVCHIMSKFNLASLPGSFEAWLLQADTCVYYLFGPSTLLKQQALFAKLGIPWPPHMRAYNFGKYNGKHEFAQIGNIEFTWPPDPSIVPAFIARRVKNAMPGDRVKINSVHLALGIWVWHQTCKAFTIGFPH